MDHILVLSGSPKEIIDGVRHYANHTSLENYSLEVAKLLEAQGAKVTLIAPGQSIISARDLIAAAEGYAGQPDIKAVLHLANIASIRPAHISAQKLKVKKEAGHAIPMEVLGNVDAWKRLEAAFPGIPVIGYRNNQLTATIDNPLVKMLYAAIASIQISPQATAHISKLDPGLRRDDILSGRKIVITSGPTAERLTMQGDVITNLSSGRQGFAIAETLAGIGAQVILITGPTHLPDLTYANIATLHASDARDMYSKVMANLPADAYIGVAAVADFGIESPIDLRLKEGEPFTLKLVQNPDILQIVGTHPALRPKVVIGFAAETDQERLLEYTRNKLERKGTDAICANQISAAGSGFNQITWVGKEGVEPWEMMDKRAIGQAIGRKIVQMLGQKSSI